jgi:hypothetical protein
MSPKTLDLIFMIQDASIGSGEPQPIVFKEDIPAVLCKKSASRELATPFISQAIDNREKEALASRDHHCLYCGRKATCLYSTPVSTLHSDPPTIFNLAQALCTKDGSTPCAREAYTRIEEGMRDPNGPIVKEGISFVDRL